jgi:mannose-6-phosphate isomerase-like protein (cupin superfamily)
MTYQVAHLDDLDRLPVEHGLEWRFIRRRFGIRAFGVNAYTAEKPGDWVVEEHTETQYQHEELYVVVRGRARFTLDGEEEALELEPTYRPYAEQDDDLKEVL